MYKSQEIRCLFYKVISKKIQSAALGQNFTHNRIKKPGLSLNKDQNIVVNTGDFVFGKKDNDNIYLKTNDIMKYKFPDPRNYKLNEEALSACSTLDNKNQVDCIKAALTKSSAKPEEPTSSTMTITCE